MEVISNSLNVEEIMKEIRQTIDQKGYRKIPLSFEDIPIGLGVSSEGPFDKNRMDECLRVMNNQFSVITYRVLEPGPRKFGKLIVFMKKVVRNLVRYYVDTIVEQQNEFNRTTVQFATEIANYINDNHTSQDEMRVQVDLLKEVRLLRQENEALKVRLDHLQAQMDECRNSKA